MIVALLLLARLYHNETVASLWTSQRSHVVVSGVVVYVKHEADGDWHLRISDGESEKGHHWFIAEVIPLIPLPIPKVGACVTVRGIRRFDNERLHNYPEVHPVERIDEATCEP